MTTFCAFSFLKNMEFRFQFHKVEFRSFHIYLYKKRLDHLKISEFPSTHQRINIARQIANPNVMRQIHLECISEINYLE